MIDTAINYRCQKSERIIGAALRSLCDEALAEYDEKVEKSGFKLTRDMFFISTKSGYVSDDADKGLPSSTLIEELIESGMISREDVAGGIHCMHPNFLRH